MAVCKFHTHSIPLDTEGIARNWEKPAVDAGIAVRVSVIVRVDMLNLRAGIGSFRVHEMIHRIAYPLGVRIRADMNLADIEATCTGGCNRITEVVDLPNTGANTERIWLLEHLVDWFSVNLGKGSTYHVGSRLFGGVVKHLDERDVSQYPADLAKHLHEHTKAETEAVDDGAGEVLDPASKTKVLVTSTAESLDDDNEEAHRLLVDSTEVTPIEDKAAEERAYDDVEVFTGDSNELVESANVVNGVTAESLAASSMKRRNRMPKEYAEHFNERSDEEKAKGGVTVRQTHERFDLVECHKPLYKPWFSGLTSALACAAFVFLLDGDPYDMVGAFVGADLGQWIRRRLFAYHLNQFSVAFMCVAAAALACTDTLRLTGVFDPIALLRNTVYIGTMLFAISGFPLAIGGFDMVKIDFPSGIQCAAYVLCIVLMVTLAGWIVAVTVYLHPGSFKPLGLGPWVNGLLRFAAAFVGVWGFSVLLNSPQHMCLIAALTGAITDILYSESQNFSVTPEMATSIDAFLAGTLASVWRSSVWRGWLPPHFGCSRIYLAVLSIMITVPGLYMYRAMWYLGNFRTMSALDWALHTFTMIICLPIGLATARMVIDKSWYYNI